MFNRRSVSPPILCRLFVTAGALLASFPLSAQETAPSPAPASGVPAVASGVPARNADEAVNRAIASEKALLERMKKVQPVIETYLQRMQRDEDLGSRPKTDDYFLGKLDLSNGISPDSFIPAPGLLKRSLDAFTHFFSVNFVPRGFAQTVVMDGTDFDRDHYQFQFVRREFLGEVRCDVFDVRPLKTAGRGRFVGRMWVEDQGYHVVRFNGTYGPASRLKTYTHFDSWRVNCGPNLWLPAYVYSEEGALEADGGLRKIAFKAQTRLWGYESKRERRGEEFTNLTVDSGQGVNDKSDQAADTSPVEATREWQRQAENNILDRLQDAGYVAPPGPVDKVLQTVLDNLEITNNINVLPEVRVRVMLTTPMESIYVGHTIVVSRGLIDVLPDEASLAAVIAHELGHVMLGHQLDTKYAFSDRLFFSDDQTLKRLDLGRSEREEEAADDKAIEILEKSPYKDKLPKVGLFLRMLSARGDELPHLIRPLLGNRMAASGKDLRMSGLMDKAPELQMERVDQIAALPLGARVKMDPWSDHLYLMKTHNVPLLSAREKLPFEITPFMLNLTRESVGQENGAVPASGQGEPAQPAQPGAGSPPAAAAAAAGNQPSASNQ
jgi:hypothetical protein